MHGEASPIKPAMKIRLYYGCHARRRRLARNPEAIQCDAPYIRAEWIEEGIRQELRFCLPSAEMNDEYRAQLRRGLQKLRTRRGLL